MSMVMVVPGYIGLLKTIPRPSAKIYPRCDDCTYPSWAVVVHSRRAGVKNRSGGAAGAERPGWRICCVQRFGFCGAGDAQLATLRACPARSACAVFPDGKAPPEEALWGEVCL
jgi:hypothetical protein